MLYDGSSSTLFFKIPEHDNLVGDKCKYTTLECSDITAADLRVTSKFGSWDTITCRLLVECRNPLIAWKILHSIEIKPKEEIDSIEKPLYVSLKQESCMVKATFDVLYANEIKNLLHRVKVAKLKERLHIQEQHKKGLEKGVRLPSKIREGLPEWVNYIPAKWYSCTVRQVFEYLIVLYTMLTLCWAVWQLHKHVSFIRRYMQPLIDFFVFYLDLLTDWFRLLDTYADILSTYWWTYMKPVYLLIYPLYTVLAQIFKPLRSVANVITALCEPVVRLSKSVFLALQPLFQPAINLCKMFTVFLKDIWSTIANTTIYQRFASEISHGSLDPLRAQVYLIRDIVYRSFRNLLFGLKFIFSRVYYTHMFLKREHEYAKEGKVENKEKKQ